MIIAALFRSPVVVMAVMGTVVVKQSPSTNDLSSAASQFSSVVIYFERAGASKANSDPGTLARGSIYYTHTHTRGHCSRLSPTAAADAAGYPSSEIVRHRPTYSSSV